MSGRAASKVASRGAERSVTWLHVTSYLLGLPTDALESLREGADPAPDRAVLDLAAFCGAESPPTEERRTLALVGEPPLDVVVRADVRVESIPVASIHPVPPYLEGLGDALGVTAVVARGGGYGLLLDVARLRSTVAHGGAG